MESAPVTRASLQKAKDGLDDGLGLKAFHYTPPVKKTQPVYVAPDARATALAKAPYRPRLLYTVGALAEKKPTTAATIRRYMLEAYPEDADATQIKVNLRHLVDEEIVARPDPAHYTLTALGAYLLDALDMSLTEYQRQYKAAKELGWEKAAEDAERRYEHGESLKPIGPAKSEKEEEASPKPKAKAATKPKAKAETKPKAKTAAKPKSKMAEKTETKPKAKKAESPKAKKAEKASPKAKKPSKK